MSKTKEYTFTVYSLGLVYSSVCTNLPKDKIAEHMAEHEPTGIGSDWRIADENFASGEKNGCPCPDTKGNRHWLVSC